MTFPMTFQSPCGKGGRGRSNDRKANVMRVLLIEDDQRLAALIKRVLQEEHHVVDLAHDGERGLDLVLRGTYDVAIVDWMLPKRDGIAVCRGVRAAGLQTALMLLTARDQTEDVVLGLNCGADDYMAKPFAFDELLARVRALGRRFSIVGVDPDELRQAGIVLDCRAHTARQGNLALELTATEWRLLEFLMRNAGLALTRRQILDYVWPYDSEVQLTMVDVYISYLRKKIRRRDIGDPIRTVRGVGYSLEKDDA